MDTEDTELDARRPDRTSSGSLFSSFAAAVLVAVGLYAALVWAGGLWQVLANTRLLDLLIRSGVVRLTDADAGFVAGVPNLGLLLKARDPVDWGLVLTVIAVFFALWGLKAVQHHAFARFCGLAGTTGQHTRAYVYGMASRRFLPFRMGDVAAVAALRAQGAPLDRAGEVVFLGRLFAVVEIAVFGVVGLFLVGWASWATLLFWGAVIAATAHYVLRSPRDADEPASTRPVVAARAAGIALVRHPALLAKATILSIVAFALEILTFYLLAMAFSSVNVIIHPDVSILIVAVVAGNLARVVQVTPGGVGQFEWAFAAVLSLSGMGMPEAVTLAVLDTVHRYVATALAYAAVTLGPGVGTSMREVFALFRREPIEQVLEGTR